MHFSLAQEECADVGYSCNIDGDCCEGTSCIVGRCYASCPSPSDNWCTAYCENLDFNDDEVVDGIDLSVCTGSIGNGIDDPCEDNDDLACVSSHFGACPRVDASDCSTDCRTYDNNNDGVINILDVIIVSQNYCNINACRNTIYDIGCTTRLTGTSCPGGGILRPDGAPCEEDVHCESDNCDGCVCEAYSPPPPPPPPPDILCNVTTCREDYGYTETNESRSLATTCDEPGYETLGTYVYADGNCACCIGLECNLIAFPNSGQSPLDVTFILLASGFNIDRWQLNYGDGTQECNPNPCPGNPNGLTLTPAHTYSSGFYDAILTVWDTSNEDVSDSETIKVAVNNLYHTANTGTSIDWTWDAVSGEDVYYRIYSRPYVFLNLTALSPWELPESPITTNSFQQTYFMRGDAAIWPQNFSDWVWNMESNFGVEACQGYYCMSIVEATAATSIEIPNIIECSNNTESGFTVEVETNERPFYPEIQMFTYWDTIDWGVNNNSGVKMKVEKGGVLVEERPWLAIDPPSMSPYVSLSPWVVTDLDAGTTYQVCAQSRNQDADLNGLGDYRPGPTANDWFCVECATQGGVPSGPFSIGHIRIQGPSGVIKLDLISVADAIAEGRGVIKVAMTAGDTNSAAYLVATTDLDASAVHVMTPSGIMAWRELP